MAGEDIIANLIGLVLGCIPCAAVLAIPVFFIAIIALVIWFALKQRGKYEAALKALAQELGGEFKKGSISSSPTLSGEFEGRKFFIDTFTRTRRDMDNRNETSYYMRIQLWHKGSVKGEIAIYREGLFSGLGKALGAQDIQVGNEEFDKAFMVKGEDEKQVKSILDSDLQQKFLQDKTALSILSDRVYFEYGVHIDDKEKIKKILRLMNDVAEKVEKL
jgi:hypothetical protein